MVHLERALHEAGGTGAPPARTGRLRVLLLGELERGRRELGLARSGYEAPICVATATCDEAVLGVAPVPAGLRADAHVVTEREWRMAAALAGALCASAGLAPPRSPRDLVLRAGELEGHLVLAVDGGDAELAAVAYEEATQAIDRLRTRALALPGHVLDAAAGTLRAPIGDAHPLRVAEALARLGGRPADPASVEAREEAVLDLLGWDGGGPARPHDDPDPSRRAARRILQRLHGMGKWGGYHTEFSHLAKGFKGNDRALAEAVGEALLAAGLWSRSAVSASVTCSSTRAGRARSTPSSKTG